MAHFFLFLHLLGLILWLGPSTGGYYVSWAARRTGKPSLVVWAMGRAHALYNLEHAGFALLVVGGLGQLALGPWRLAWPPPPGEWWLADKIILFLAVVIPLEILDIYAINFLLGPSLLAAKFQTVVDKTQPPNQKGSFFLPAVAGLPPSLDRAIRFHDRFMAWALVVFIPTVTVMGVLAIWKPF